MKDLTDTTFREALATPCENKKVDSSRSINILEVHEDEAVMAIADEPEFLEIEVALDSGSGSHVADRVDLPGYAVAESEGSRRNQSFLAAAGKSIKNEGEICVALVADNDSKKGQNINSTFQIAAITRPLWSVSQILDNLPEDHEAVFKRNGAKIKDGRGRGIALFERKGGLYVSKMKLRNPKHAGFRRRA